MGIIRNDMDNRIVYTLNGEEVLSAAIQMEQSVKIIAVKGAIKTMAAPCMAEIIEEHLHTAAHLILDLAEVSYIASAGLRVLLNMQQEIDEEENLDVTIRNVSENVMGVLEATGFIDILQIEK